MNEIEHEHLSKHFKSFEQIIMTHEQIIKIESEPLFKIWLRRVGFKSTQEYFDLFGDDREQREIAVKRYKLTK